MKTARTLFTAILLIFIKATLVSQSLAPTPPMGWNSWNFFEVNINEQLIKEIADVMVSSGMRDAGYEYLVLDDGWMAPERDANGRLQADPQKFPSGMKALGDYIHLKGLKFGIYECRGYLTCQKLPGSFEHEEIDMASFAEWGVDYIKLDACYAEKNGRLTTEDLQIYKDAIEKTGRPMILSISDFGNGAWAWGGKKYGQLWRTSYDIYPWIENVYHHAESSGGDSRIHPAFNGLWQFAGPGHWNDPDMLEIGNLISEAEDKIHMSLWCILAAPLMTGNDLRAMTEATKRVLTAPEVIAINQDPRGHQGYKVFDNGKQQVYNKPLSDGTTAVLLYNKDTIPANVSVSWAQIGLSGKQPVRDLWERKNLGKFENGFTAWQLPEHGQYLLKVGKAGGDALPGPEPVPEEKYIADGNGYAYLSDLYYIMKYGSAPWYDKNPEGDSIVINNQSYGKGISTIDGTILLYKLDGKSFRFRAMVGLDGSYKGNGTGRFKVLEEDAFGGRVIFDSGIMTKDSAARQIDIDVRNMATLFLKFDGKDGAVGSWGHARLVGSWDSHRVEYDKAYVDSIISKTELIPIKVTGPKDNRINIVIINRWEKRDTRPYNNPEMRAEFLEDVKISLLAAFTPGDPRAQTAYANYSQFYNLYALWWPDIPEWRDGVETDLIDAIRDRMFLPWKDDHHGWVTFLIMPNRDGGGGGAARNMETRTGNALIVGNAIGKMLHEISHTATSIGDEYAGFATDTMANAGYTVTKNTDPKTIKWRAWIDEETPVPTPYTRKYIDKIGAFEGAQYHLLNYYRPSAQGCIMGAGVFDNTEEMCPVCEQRLSMRAYELVYPIENIVPVNNEFVVDKKQAVTFSVTRVKPEPDTQEAWWVVNGEMIARGKDQLELDIDPQKSYEIVYCLRDTTSFIREDPPYGQYPYREHRWRINQQLPLAGEPFVFAWENTTHHCTPGRRFEAEFTNFDRNECRVVDFGGASGLKYLQINNLANGLEWTIEVPETGTYALNWSFASRIAEAVKCDLHLNGELYMKGLDFHQTVPLFTGWNGRTVNLKLQKGKNVIRLKSSEKISLNIDYLRVPDKPIDNQEISVKIATLSMDMPVSTVTKSKKRLYSPERVKSANLLMWLDASDIVVSDKTPYQGWIEKVGRGKGPDVVFKPNTLNGSGVAGFDIVWLSGIEKPVKGFQTIMMVYKESDMSFPGTSPFRDLDKYIGRPEYGSCQLFSDGVSPLTKEGRVFVNGVEVDPMTTGIPEGYFILTVELSQKVTDQVKYTQGYWEGDLAEIMLFDASLSDKEREKLERCLMEKWLTGK
jgi:hypothetical protein